MSVQDIQAQLQDLYRVEVSGGLISNVTDAVGTPTLAEPQFGAGLSDCLLPVAGYTPKPYSQSFGSPSSHALLCP
jgi:hypothetical protein